MKHLVVKDRNLRRELKNLDKKKFLFKFLKYKESNLAGKLNSRCVVSYRERSVLRFFKQSRIVVRNLALKGNFPGIVKSS
jgi:ribosomal protein S14